MDVAGSCVLYVSKYFHLLLKFPLGVAKKSYRIVNTMVNLDSFYGETFPHPLKSLVSICSVTDKPKVLLGLPFCPAHGFSTDGSRGSTHRERAGTVSPLGLSPLPFQYQHKQQKYLARKQEPACSQFPQTLTPSAAW